jgi:nickel-dependent lactate racemase
MLIGKGLKKGYLSEEEIVRLSKKSLLNLDLQNKRVLVIIPDHTRTAPIDLFFKIIFDSIGNKVKKLDYIIALGTHPPLIKERIFKLVGISHKERGKVFKNKIFQS